MKKLLTAAIEYVEKYDFSIIPTKRDKKALIKWEEFQKRKATRDEIMEWWKKWPNANTAIVTGAISGNLGVIDRDTDEGREALEGLLPDSFITPTVVTPRKGSHIYCRIPSRLELSNNSRLIPGCDFRGEGGYILAPPSVTELGHYEFLPGLSLDDISIAPLPQAYIGVVTSQADHANSFINNKLHSLYKGCRHSVDIFTKGRRNNDVFHLANCLAKGGMPANEMLQTLEFIGSKCTPPLSLKEVETIIQSALKRFERRGVSLAQEVKEWICLQNGYFSSTDVYNCLQLSTRDEKKNVHIILKRLCEEGLIEKYGNKAGCFKVIDTAEEEIDFLNASSGCLHIKWPFGIEEYVKTLPKNIVVIAGVSNSGKTAFLLNFIEMNMDNHDIFYLSSEMGNVELRDRLSKFERSLNSWKFKPIERSSNFSDVIRKDAINIIDFLEIHDEFWKIGGMIKDIYDKLHKGVAVIAIQKNPGSTYGLGGARGLEKARLYLTIDNHKLKIEKGKNWTTTANPNGLVLHFKLLQGCHFITEQDWGKET
jgi:hypothetical protein